MCQASLPSRPFQTDSAPSVAAGPACILAFQELSGLLEAGVRRVGGGVLRERGRVLLFTLLLALTALRALSGLLEAGVGGVGGGVLRERGRVLLFTLLLALTALRALSGLLEAGVGGVGGGVLRERGRVLAQEEGGEGEVAAQPHAAQVAHGVPRAQDRQAQRDADAAQHQDGEHEQRLRTAGGAAEAGRMAGVLSQMRHCAVLGAIWLQICTECREIPGKRHTAKRVKSCNIQAQPALG